MENSRIIVTYVSVYSWTTTKKSWWTMSNKPSYNKKPKLTPWWLNSNDNINQFACSYYRLHHIFRWWHSIYTAILLCNQFWIVDNGYLQWVHTPTLDLLILEIDNFLPVNVWTRIRSSTTFPIFEIFERLMIIRLNFSTEKFG